jgi:hypothetical protein
MAFIYVKQEVKLMHEVPGEIISTKRKTMSKVNTILEDVNQWSFTII